jgi:hypothetical protein
MVAFDPHNQMWCVSSDNDFGRWDGSKLEGLGKPGGWNLQWVYFNPRRYSRSV